MRTYSTLLAVVLFGSAAPAGDPTKGAAEKFFDCNFRAASFIAVQDGHPVELAERAINLCRDEERILKRFIDPRALTAMRAGLTITNAMQIELERRMLGWKYGAAGPGRIQCASCGLLPRFDQKLRVWRPHGR